MKIQPMALLVIREYFVIIWEGKSVVGKCTGHFTNTTGGAPIRLMGHVPLSEAWWAAF